MNKLIEIKIKRFFYPIGQGAFYAEKHQIGDKYFTIVYDCGTCRNCKKGQLKFADTVIEKAFKKDDTIDILFISHFDYDHVSKIAKLKEHTHIKKVIMPLLHKNERYLLINIYRVLKFRNIIPLLEDPEKFFGKNTSIIRIEPVNNNEIGEFEPIILVEETNNSMILKSGQHLKINSDSDWIFIPYNHEYKNRHKELVQELYNAGFDDKEIKSLQNGTRWTTKNFKDIKKFKKIYNTLSKHGKNTSINENSMLLYSGTPTNEKFKKKSCSYDLDKKIKYGISVKDDRVSCIYTGDTTLSVVDIKTVFKGVDWDTVGTIQIPHHGDKESFDKNILDKKNYCCPISVGTNPYKHPSKNLIDNIELQDSYPILVGEDLKSGFIECIDNKYYIAKEKLGCLKHLINLK